MDIPDPEKQSAPEPLNSSCELQPLPYHMDVVQHLRRHAKAVWRYYGGERTNPGITDAQRLYLLKSTVELKRESHENLYALADEVAVAIGLGVPLEIYQGEDAGGMNASLLFLPSTARVVFHGPLQERLDQEELRALLGHELAHHRLWSVDDGVYFAAWHALQGMDGMAALPSVENTLRLYSLSTEVFADRVALEVAGLEATIGCLLKMRTGLSDVKPLDFLDQSRELHAAESTGSRGWSHPEAHIRALAADWYGRDSMAAEERIRELIEGPIQLDELDLVRRDALDALTERLVGTLLQPTWFQTETVLGHARLMFDDYEVPDHAAFTADDRRLDLWGDTVRDYLAYLLADFVGVDTDLEDLPFLQAHAVAEDLGIESRLERAVNRELRKTKKAIREMLDDRDERLASAVDEGKA